MNATLFLSLALFIPSLQCLAALGASMKDHEFYMMLHVFFSLLSGARSPSH